MRVWVPVLMRSVRLFCLVLFVAMACSPRARGVASRKQFSRADFSKSLRDLGLTPSAVRISD